jgi:hypothetical protein
VTICGTAFFVIHFLTVNGIRSSAIRCSALTTFNFIIQKNHTAFRCQFQGQFSMTTTRSIRKPLARGLERSEWMPASDRGICRSNWGNSGCCDKLGG